MDFHKTCRSCLATKEELYNLFLTSTVEMFSFCTSIQVSESDSLPKTLCYSCFDLLNKLFFFKQQCVRSDQTLHEYIKSQEDIKPSKTIKIEITPDIFLSNQKSNDGELKKLAAIDDSNDKDDRTQNIFSADSHDFDDNCCETTYNTDLLCSNKHYNNKKSKVKKKKLEKLLKIKGKRFLEERKNLNLNYPCVQCNKKFAYPERLEAHMLIHEGLKKEIVCHICNKKFKQWDGLRRHREFVHMSAGKTLECPTCGKLYKTIMTLRHHQKIHQERKDFVCHICGGSYRSAGGLQNHVETHRENREKNHECTVCGKKFVSSSYLTSHMFRHKERRFVCHICRFPFFTKADLTRHMLIHNGIKPFVCEICNKAYSTKSFLIEHGRTHSGERPFSCDYCAMNFISKRRLIDHRRTHTGEKPHKCDKCNQAFIQRGSLTRHLKVHDKLRYTEGSGVNSAPLNSDANFIIADI